jgi:hypothetical protein
MISPRKFGVLLCLASLAAAAPQQGPEELRRAIGDLPLTGPWIYDDVNAGFAEAKASGKPLAVFLRCVP